MNIGTLLVSLQADTTGIQKAELVMDGLGDTIMKVGGMMAGIFAADKIIAFSKESMKLAASMEGVHTAFNRIGASSKVFDELKVATRGATDNFKLMQLAVKATDAGIATKDLITYLTFASERAITLGKSVDEFSELIVKGAIRKFARSMAPMALSVKEVTAAFKTNSFPQYIEAQMEKMGTVTDTMAIKLAKYTASVTNLKLVWGDFLIKSPMIADAITGLTHRMQILGDTSLTAWQKFWMGWNAYSKFKVEQTAKEDEIRKQLTGLNLEDLVGLQKAATNQYISDPTYIKILNEMIAAMKASLTPVKAVIETLATLRQKYIDEQDELSKINVLDTEGIANQKAIISATKARIDAIEKLDKTLNLHKLALDEYEAHLKSTTEAMKGPSAITNLNEQQPIDYQKFFMKMRGATGFGISQEMQNDIKNQLALIDVQAKILGNTFDTDSAKTQVWTKYLEQLWSEGFRPGNAEIDSVIKHLQDLNKNMYQNTLIDKMSHGLIKQSEVVRTLTNSFQELFSKTGKGFQGMIDTMIAGIEKLISELLAKAMIWVILNMITGNQAGTFMSFMGLAGLGKGGAGGLRNSVIPGLAGGGTIPQGFSNDSYLARLSSGETVLPANTMGGINRQIDINLEVEKISIEGSNLAIWLRRVKIFN